MLNNIVTVQTPAEETDLTTLDRVKEELELTSSSEDDWLMDLIHEASDTIRTALNGRVLPRQTYVEKVPGYGGQRLMLTHRPIVSVSSILLDNMPVTGYEILRDEGCLFMASGWDNTTRYRGFLTRGPIPGSNEPLYIVTYTAGYLVPCQDGANLPGDIERAAIATVKSWRYTRHRDPAVRQKRVGDLAIQYAGMSTTALPIEAVNFLNPYKSLV